MHFIEVAERWLSRAHLLQWLVMTLVFAVTTWIAYAQRYEISYAHFQIPRRVMLDGMRCCD
jgi:hypothetical protein